MDASSEYKRNQVPVSSRPLRADARRNAEAILEAARTAFATGGADVPMKQIADSAGVGVGTLYRHFPTRSDLIEAYLVEEFDAHAEAAATLLAELPPQEALARWMRGYVDFLGSKPKLAPALGDGPARDGLRDYFWQRLGPALSALLDAGVASGEIRSGIDAADLLTMLTDLGHSAAHRDRDYRGRVVSFLIDGLRVRDDPPTPSDLGAA